MPAENGSARLSLAEGDIRALQAEVHQLRADVTTQHQTVMQELADMRGDLKLGKALFGWFDRLSFAGIAAVIGALIAEAVNRLPL